MPSTATITAFTSFSANTLIRSAQVNTNFSNFRGHNIPIDPNTATASNNSYDLGSSDYNWRSIYYTTDILLNGSTINVGIIDGSGNISTTGNIFANGTLTIGGASTFNGNMSITGSLDISGTITSDSDVFQFGDSATGNQTIKFNRGGSDPEIRWNESVSTLEFSNDGSTYYKFIPSEITITGTTIDWDAANIFVGSIATATTYAFTNTGNGKTINVVLTADTSDREASFTATSGIRWNAATPVTTVALSTASFYTFVQTGGIVYANAVDSMS